MACVAALFLAEHSHAGHQAASSYSPERVCLVKGLIRNDFYLGADVVVVTGRIASVLCPAHELVPARRVNYVFTNSWRESVNAFDN
jgi:hypothetical protein